MHQVKTGERDEEDEPARELVEEAHCLFWIPVLHTEPGAKDPGRVGYDRDGDAGESQNDAPGGLALDEIAVDDGHCEETHEGADAAACLSHLQLHCGQLNDISFLQHGNAGQGQEPARCVGGKKLEWKRDVVQDQGRQGNAEQRNEENEFEMAEHRPSAETPDDSGGDQEKGGARQEQICAEDSDHEEKQTCEDQADSLPCGPDRDALQFRALVPK